MPAFFRKGLLQVSNRLGYRLPFCGAMLLASIFYTSIVGAQPTEPEAEHTISGVSAVREYLLPLADRLGVELQLFPALHDITLSTQDRVDELTDLDVALPDGIGYRLTSDWLLIAPDLFLQDQHNAWVTADVLPICAKISVGGERFDRLVIGREDFFHQVDDTYYYLVIEPWWFGSSHAHVYHWLFKSGHGNFDLLSEGGRTTGLGRATRRRQGRSIATEIFYSDDYPILSLHPDQSTSCTTTLD